MNRNPDVDSWLDDADHPLDATMRRAREIILGADDRVTESVKWKTPTFSFKGNIASFNPSKNVVSIMFHRGSEIPGDHPRLEGDGKLVRTMRFSDLDELEAGRAVEGRGRLARADRHQAASIDGDIRHGGEPASTWSRSVPMWRVEDSGLASLNTPGNQ